MDERLIRSTAQAVQTRFAAEWEGFDRRRREKTGVGYRETLALLRSYEALLAQLYRVRAHFPPQDPFRRGMEDFAADITYDLTALQRAPQSRQLRREWVNRYRRIWRENLALFLFTAILFVASIVVGWQLALTDIQWVGVIVPQTLLESILDKHRWFDSLAANPVVDGMMIAVNNIKVCLLCFAMGAALGVGGMLALVYNGLLFGGVLGFCYVNHFDGPLLQFVVGHGPLELSVIVASAFTSFLFGRVYFMRPRRLFRARMAEAGSEAACLISGIVPWLCLAATLEAFVSPLPFPVAYKLSAGIVAAALFWAWTAWPISSPTGSLSATGSTGALRRSAQYSR